MENKNIYKLVGDYDLNNFISSVVQDSGFIDATYCDVEHYFRYETNPIITLSSTALEVGQQNFELIRNMPELKHIDDEDLLILYSWAIAKYFQKKSNISYATNNANYESYESENIDRYGSRNKAENRLYEHYMENIPVYSDELLNYIIEAYKTQKKSIKR